MKNIFLLLVFYLSALGAFAQPIAGPNVVCTGSSITVSDGSSGGTWASSTTAVATIGSSSGLIIAISAGVTTITYNFSGGGFTTYPVTVYATPAPISGPSSVCVGQTILLTDPVPGSTWSSSNPCATVSSGGVVTGISAPCVAIITYGNPGCQVTHPVTVNAAPAAITGTMTICGAGNITSLSDPTAGGSYSGGSPCVTVAAGTGVCTGITAPCTGIVTYTLPDGCSTTATVTVFAIPSVSIPASQVLCAGAVTTAVTFSGSTVPGTVYNWTNSNTSIGLAASGSGNIAPFTAINTGSSPVVATITVTPVANGCSGTPQTFTITVNPLPPVCAVTGGGVCCPGGTGVHIGLSCSTPGINYQLMCGTAPVGAPLAGTGAALDFGLFCTACVYTVVATNSVTGCSSTMTGSATVTIGTLPPLCNVTGGGYCCAGSSGVPVGLSCSTPGINYQLYCGTTPLGSVLAGTGGPLNFGLFCSNCTYKVVATNATTGCTDTMNGSATVIVAPLPSVFSVSGGGSYCDSSTGCPHIYLSNSQLGVTYKVYCGTTIITTRAGTGSALDFGPECLSCTYTVTATDDVTGCTSNMLGSASVSITAPPAAISGSTIIVCPATTTTLTDPTLGGTWSSLNPSCGTVSPSGVVTATNPGPGPCSAVIKYQTAGGCYVTVTVNIPYCPGPVVRDTTSCCVDSIIINTGYNPITNTSIAANANGTSPATDPRWIVSNISTQALTEITGMGSSFVAVSTPSGKADLILRDTTFWPCTLTNSGWISCLNSNYFTTDLGVYTYTLTRPFTMCHGGSIKIDCWLLHDNNLPTVKIDGSIVLYTEPAISSTDASCPGYHLVSTITLGAGMHTLDIVVQNHDASAGLNPFPNPSGLDLKGTISIADDSAGLVNEAKVVPCCCAGCEITGNTHICVGATTALSSCSSCAWSSSNTSVATVGSCTGVVTGIAGGTVTITHVSDIGCSSYITVTVDALPTVCTVTGGGSYCTGGPCPTQCPHVYLSCSQVGVNYQLYCGSTAVPPMLAGTGAALDFGPQCGPCTYTIKGTSTIGCTSYMSGSVTCTPIAPCPIAGPTTLCVGGNITLTSTCSPTPPCPWSSSDGSVATVSCTGVVHGVAGGVVTISYTNSAGCISTYNVTVTAVCPITGNPTVCVGTTTTLSASPCVGGVWSSSNPACVTVGAATGVCTGISAPCCATIDYTMSSGCVSTFTVCVLTAPAVPTISAPTTICLPGTATITGSALPSGSSSLWWLAPPVLGSLSCTTNCASTVFTGLSTGVQTINYIVYNACGSNSATTTVSVGVLPPISGLHSVCVGQNITLSEAPISGTWTSSNPGVASVTAGPATTTTVHGVTPGLLVPTVVTITFTTTGGCSTTWLVTVNPLPVISGNMPICQGAGITLTVPPPGGSWLITTGGFATLYLTTATSTGVYGINPGNETVTFTSSATGCSNTVIVTVNASPVITSGPSNICWGTLITYTASLSGGNWSIVPATHVTINSTTGALSYPGTDAFTSYTAIITFTKGGCSTTKTVTINPSPSIVGPSNICIGAPYTEASSTGSSGTWSLTPPSPIATLSSFSGASVSITGNLVGSVVLHFTATSGCPAPDKTIGVHGIPNPGGVTYGVLTISPAEFCVFATGVTVGMGSADMTGSEYTASWITTCSPFVTVSPYTGAPPVITTTSYGGSPATIGCTIIYHIASNFGCGTRESSGSFILDACGHKEGREGDSGLTNSSNPQLEVFPNPNEGTFTVNMVSDKNEAADVKITNVVGETVRTFTTVTNKENAVKIDNAAGMYLISVTTAHGTYVAKVVVE